MSDGEILELSVEAGLLTKSGAWFACGETRLGNGKEAAKASLAENDDLRNRLIESLRQIAAGEQGKVGRT
jgi:recombination protein RecA